MSVAWPEKMITQGEAFAKAARWPVAACVDYHPDTGAVTGITLRCTQVVQPHPDLPEHPCAQSLGQLRRGAIVYNGSLDEMLSMVLRHMVMAHAVPLNTRAKAQDIGPSDGSSQ